MSGGTTKPPKGTKKIAAVKPVKPKGSKVTKNA